MGGKTDVESMVSEFEILIHAKLEWKLGSVIHHVKACDAVNKVELLKVGARTHPLKMGSTHFV